MNAGENRQLSLQVLKKFRVIFGAVRQHFREVEQQCGVSGSQLWIMQEVSRSGGIGVSELAERLSIHQSTCSLLVEKLVRRKLLVKERSKIDKRCVGLHLTAAGEKIVSNAPGPAEGVLPQALEELTAKEIEQLDGALELVIRQLHADEAELAARPLADL